MRLARPLLTIALLCLRADPLVASGFWAPVEPPRAKYLVTVGYSPDTQQLRGTETIRFRNHTRRSIHRLAFRWFGEILSVRSNGAPASPPPGRHTQHLYELPLPIEPGRDVELVVDYAAGWPLNPRNGSQITSFLNPRLWWGFGTHDDYEVEVRVPEGYAFATSGRHDPASGRLVANGVRTFGLFVGKGYETAEADAGGVLVRTVFTRAGRACAERLLRSAVDAIGFYRERFGLYPQTQLSIVPGMAEPAGGYSAATGLVVVHGQERLADRPEQHWRWIMAHEIGHQYWGEYVLADGPDPLPWLMLGMGIHADREYRRARGITAGALEANYARGVAEGNDTTIDLTDEQREAARFDVNNVVDHGKSAALLNALESVLGEDVFEVLYRRCLREYAGRRLGWRELQRLAEAEAGEDLGWFFEQWVRSSKVANYRVAESACAAADGGYTCTVKVERLGQMRMPLIVLARFADGQEQRARTERLADVDVLTFSSSSPLKEAVLAPEGALALIDSASDRQRELVSRIGALRWQGSGREALEVHQALQSGAAVEDPGSLLKLGLLLYDGAHYPEALTVLTKIRDGASASMRFAARVWEGHVLDLLGRRAEAESRYREALAIPGSPRMRHDQYSMTIDADWARARLLTPFRRE